MQKNLSIVWFRQDLRVNDNISLLKASEEGDILPIFIFDDCAPSKFKIGAASKVWLHHSLEKLNESLDKKLNLYVGNSAEIFEQLIDLYSVQSIFWNTCYEPWLAKQEVVIKKLCDKKNIHCQRFNSNYLWHPNDILKDDQSYYKVFTAYKKKSYFKKPRNTVNSKKNLTFIKDKKNSVSLENLNLLPTDKDWHKPIEAEWEIGEKAAQKKLNKFIERKLNDYKTQRDFPKKNHTSLLSPHLHFGEISPVQIWEQVQKFGPENAKDSDLEHFLSEVIWREFSVYLLFHFEKLPSHNFNAKFDNFPWKKNKKLLDAWKKGKTGYPIIDAGMRQLWQTGYMHNRVRMIVASFLIKNLNIHWHEGRDWFWDCLVDADLANNSASWQWVAGSGADAAPYFRIFNPITQSEKFDKEGEYIKTFVPELKKLPMKYLSKPWEAPRNVLIAAGISLGKDYPLPIIDLPTSRNQALEAYKNL